jgi:hypothetical protein
VSFVSEPKKLTVPDEPYYPIERLWLFDRHTRATWEQTFGEQAPPWDKERRIKRWADTTALEGVADPANQLVEYNYFDLTSRSFKKLVLTAREAALPNLPGRYVYPKYVVEPTPAVVAGPPPLEPQPLRADLLSRKEEAQALAAELNADEVVESLTFTSGPFRIEWKGESRRQWLVRIGPEYYNAGLLLKSKYANGIGAPGRWEKSPLGPVWVSFTQDTGDQDPRPEIPIPCRLLDPREALHVTPFGVLVYRKDIESELNPRPAAASGLTPQQAEMLARIDANVQQLLDVQQLLAASLTPQR